MGIIGLPANRKYGSMLFRAGQDPLRDVVAFCGESNLGVFSEQGMMGHIWLEFDDELIDFSSGDWVAQGSHVLALEAQHAAANGYELSGPIQFEIDPPKYIWQPAAPLMNAWKPKGEPDLGDLWYGPVGKYSDPPNSIADGLKEIVKIAYFSQKPRIEALRLAERVNEWKRR